MIDEIEQWQRLACSQAYVIEDLASFCHELIDELKDHRDVTEAEKVLGQILGEEVHWYEFENREIN